LSKIAVVVFAGICSSWLLGLLLFHGRNYGRLYFGTDTRAAALLIGCLGAVAFKAGWATKIPGRVTDVVTTAAFAALVGFALTRYNITQYPAISLYFGVIDVVALVLVLGVLERPDGPVAQLFKTRPFTTIGRLSYGLYLFPREIGAHGRFGGGLLLYCRAAVPAPEATLRRASRSHQRRWALVAL
jgi:peptidoglycan/LPS O-acetylase OafA/YrhL